MSDPESNLLVELRGPFNGCCFKERCIAWIETLERENLNLLHEQERLEREVAALREALKNVLSDKPGYGAILEANELLLRKDKP